MKGHQREDGSLWVQCRDVPTKYICVQSGSVYGFGDRVHQQPNSKSANIDLVIKVTEVEPKSGDVHSDKYVILQDSCGEWRYMSVGTGTLYCKLYASARDLIDKEQLGNKTGVVGQVDEG